MLWTSALAVLVAFEATLATAVPHAHVVHEERQFTSIRWTKRDRVRPMAKLPVRIGLVQSNMDRAEDFLLDVSDPGSPNYGKHWSAEQVIEAFRPSDDTVTTVMEWLIDAGIPADSITHSDNKAWLAFHAPTHQMESLLHTKYYDYEDAQTGGILPACDCYHVPKHIHKHIDYITPGIKLLPPRLSRSANQMARRTIGTVEFGGGTAITRFGSVHEAAPSVTASASGNLSDCYMAVTPACIAALYQIPRATTAHPNNTHGVFEAEAEYWNQEALNSYFSKYSPYVPNGTHPHNNDIDGAVATTKNYTLVGPEAEIDLQIIYPIVYPQNVTVFDEDDIHYQSWANDTYTWGFNTPRRY